ncbi:hypothetical protein [Salinispora tropica]|uniref:Uncharacterized protein n=1 Tax=Salinispora tropica (strain ATCC BAA-916 / DSM 44818 / JCM 13857 / NBRC 105044 / CNB-440) TaxID=369723 RepID=A4XCP2_SALTO|nr:hypothetical protein [Salinispora tropica]ABP56699.1 hypothetical protein Strop_4271 [Salinispora tropica CNB-440]
MRLTVGPLPPAVYWRRRAVVLGAAFLLLVVVLYSWGNSEEPAKNASGQEQATSSDSTPDPETPADAEQPDPLPPGDSGDAGGADPPNSEPSEMDEVSDPPPSAPPATDDGTCTDDEISVTAVALPASVGQGGAVDLQLKIKNSSDRTCSRDVGADLQELFLKSGAATIWSSDSCGTGEGSDVQSFTPNFVRSYQIRWNGNDDTRCSGGVAVGPEAPPGTYQLLARVGTKYSAPVEIKITG